MTNRPKQIGTAAETAVKKVFQRHGFPRADRRALAGSADVGDILVCSDPIVIAEVKGGNMARTASDNQVAAWLEEAERERVNAGATIAMLVWARKGIGEANAHRWWTIFTPNSGVLPTIARLYLADACSLLFDTVYPD